jgi:serine/threonine protein kinase
VPACPLQIEEHSSDDDKKKTINQYTVHEVLGRGAFGTVRRVTSKQEGHRVDYAMKEMSKKQLQVCIVGGWDAHQRQFFFYFTHFGMQESAICSHT